MITLSTEWLSVCGGCDVAIADLHENIFNLLKNVKILHAPLFTDIKDYPDADIGIISGAIRSDSDRSHAKKMRDSCKKIIAFGTCAVFGGISGAGFLHTNQEIFDAVYCDSPSTPNPQKILPIPTPEGIPALEETVTPLDKVIDVDLYLSGCPPHARYIFESINALINNKPPANPYRTVCARCERKMVKMPETRELKPFFKEKFDDTICFLSQGCLCFGSVTLERCRMVCPNKGMICTGCAGPSVQILQEPNRDIRTELAERISKLTSIKEEVVVAEIEKFSKTYYAYAMASDMIGKKPTFQIKKWSKASEEKSSHGKNHNN